MSWQILINESQIIRHQLKEIQDTGLHLHVELSGCFPDLLLWKSMEKNVTLLLTFELKSSFVFQPSKVVTYKIGVHSARACLHSYPSKLYNTKMTTNIKCSDWMHFIKETSTNEMHTWIPNQKCWMPSFEIGNSFPKLSVLVKRFFELCTMTIVLDSSQVLSYL